LTSPPFISTATTYTMALRALLRILPPVTADPKFMNPVGGSDGRSTAAAYKLQATSPAINAGKTISGNGGQDFWGAPIVGAADIGAYEYNTAYSDTVNPTVPANLTAQRVNDVSVQLTWSGSYDQFGVTGYNIYKNVDWQVGTAPRTANSFLVTGLTSNTAYMFSVKSADAAGRISGESNRVTVTTASSPPALSAAKASAAVTVDGNLTEAGWSVAAPADKTISGTPNNTVLVGTMWDANYLYIGAKITDAALQNDSGVINDDDSIDVYIDADRNRSTVYDSFDRHFTFGYNDTVFTEKNNKTTGVMFATTPVTGGYQVEVAIPWSNLGITPAAGLKLGFDLANNDDDDGSTRDSQLMWNGTGNNYQNTSAFGDVLLMP
jgi:chitodextrinase